MSHPKPIHALFSPFRKLFFGLIVCTPLAGGCVSSPSSLEGADLEKKDTPGKTLASPTALEQRLGQLESKVSSLEAQLAASSAGQGQMEFKLQAQSSDIFQLKKKIFLNNQTKRSGSTLERPPLHATGHLPPQPEKELHDPPPQGEAVVQDFSKSLAATPLEHSQESASALLEIAKGKVSLGQFGDAVVVLSDLQSKAPQFEDSGESLLLLASCWMQLDEPQNVLPVVRQLYLRFPTSAFLLRAKLIEARAQEKIGAKQLSLSLLKEVLALRPTSLEAQEARALLARMRTATE